MDPIAILTPPERRTKVGMMSGMYSAGSPDVEGWYAEVRTLDMSVYRVSRLDGETGWTVDAAFSGRGMPLWVNGYGARYLMTRQIADAIAAELDRLTDPDAPICAHGAAGECPGH